ncbi:MAG: hypothetical protein ACI8TP_003905 [Acidimicrobiales bacterium]|jgi:hypothetical protein
MSGSFQERVAEVVGVVGEEVIDASEGTAVSL